MDSDAAHFVVLLHIFGPLATLNRDTDKSQWKWLCGHNHLKRYLGYICHHPTLFYCIDSILPAEQTLKHWNLWFVVLYIVAVFARQFFVLLCIVWIKRQNYIELVTSLFCHIFCITFIVISSVSLKQWLFHQTRSIFFLHRISPYQKSMLPLNEGWKWMPSVYGIFLADKKARTEKVSQHCSEKCALIELYTLNAKELQSIESAGGFQE